MESPGSIAELGAFAASESLRPKTLAILNTSFGSDRSFIADGPVRRIKNGNKDLIRYYTWNPAKLGSPQTKAEFKEITRFLIEFLAHRDANRPSQVSFNAQEAGHNLLLVSDLIRIVGAASRSDLAECLEVLGCTPAVSGLDRHLSILQSVAFIAKHLRSNQAFYVRTSSELFLRYGYRPGTALKDMARIQTRIRQSHDPMRKAVIRYSLTKEDSDV